MKTKEWKVIAIGLCSNFKSVHTLENGTTHALVTLNHLRLHVVFPFSFLFGCCVFFLLIAKILRTEFCRLSQDILDPCVFITQTGYSMAVIYRCWKMHTYEKCAVFFLQFLCVCVVLFWHEMRTIATRTKRAKKN